MLNVSGPRRHQVPFTVLYQGPIYNALRKAADFKYLRGDGTR